jgi:hypothetical protein
VSAETLKAFFSDISGGGHYETTTYALGTFAGLQGLERKAAEDRLIELARQGDVRAVETLGAGNVTRSLAVLERLSAASNDLGSAAARAVLTLMGPDPAATARVAEGVTSPSQVQSAFAAFALRDAVGPDAVAGLLDALAHPFSPTRANAILGLVDKLGLTPLIVPRQSPLWTLMQRAHNHFVSVWQPASVRLREVLEALLAGESPEDLGLVYARSSREADIDEVWTPNERGFDFDALLRLRGHDLEWAYSYLYLRLQQRDDRVPEAMVVLGLVEGLPALREALPKAIERGVGGVFQSAMEALEVQASAVGDA